MPFLSIVQVKMNQKIEHDGIVTQITDKSLYVNMLVSSACTSCEAKGACGVSESEVKVVEVPNEGSHLKPGDQVVVGMDQSKGILAMFLGYMLPFLLMIIVLIVALQLTDNEAIAGLLSIGILIPYYIFLYLGRNKLKQKFTFTLKHLN